MSSPSKAHLRVGRLRATGRREKRSAPRVYGGRRKREEERKRAREKVRAVHVPVVAAVAAAPDQVVKDFYERVTGFKVTMMQPQGAHFILHGLVNVTDVIVRYVSVCSFFSLRHLPRSVALFLLISFGLRVPRKAYAHVWTHHIVLDRAVHSRMQIHEHEWLPKRLLSHKNFRAFLYFL